MTLHQLTISYPEELLLSLKTEPKAFEREARLLLALKLYEQGRISTGMAARLAEIERVTFLFELQRFGLSPIGVDPDELAADTANA
jgi:predicted HTH domain antitoxin